MNEEKNNDILFKVCRLCLEERGYVVIFDKNELLDDIYNCTGLRISPSDDLPQKICTICLDIVEKATELRVLAKKNNRYLRYLFNCPDEAPPKIGEVTQEVHTTIVVKEEVTEIKNPDISVRKDLYHTSKNETTQNSTDEVETINSLNLIRQMKPKHEIGSTEYRCPVCSKIFNKWKKLYIHHRFHNKCFKCTINVCSKKFATKSDLEKHIRTHTGEKPYACNKCKRRFAQRGTLKAHKDSVHTRKLAKAELVEGVQQQQEGAEGNNPAQGQCVASPPRLDAVQQTCQHGEPAAVTGTAA